MVKSELSQAVVALVSLLTMAACQKSEAGKAVSTSLSTPTKANCPADATRSDAGDFCFKLATGLRPKSEQQLGDYIAYDSEDGSTAVRFDISTFDESKFKSMLEEQENYAKAGKIVEMGDLPGGGKFWIYDNARGARWSASVSHGAKIIECSAGVEIASTAPNKQAILDQCKTVVPL